MKRTVGRGSAIFLSTIPSPTAMLARQSANWSSKCRSRVGFYDRILEALTVVATAMQTVSIPFANGIETVSIGYPNRLMSP